MERGFVGIVTADLHLPTATSLKDKRKPLAGLKAALARATGGSVGEVGDHDILRRSQISLAVVAVSASDAMRLCDVAERVIFSGAFEVVSIRRHVASVEELLPDGPEVI